LVIASCSGRKHSSLYLILSTCTNIKSGTNNGDTSGIPTEIEDTILILPFDESTFSLIEEYADELAGVMVEPVFGNGSLPVGKEFLESLQEICRNNDVLLMFDEVKTGFRMALGGAQEYWGVIPDLATYGKVIGGGVPLGAVGTTKEIMDKVTQSEFSISVAGTFSGNPFSLSVGLAMLNYLVENKDTIYPELERKGNRLWEGFNEYMRLKNLPASVTGIGSFFQTHMKPLPVIGPRDLGGVIWVDNLKMLSMICSSFYDIMVFM